MPVLEGLSQDAAKKIIAESNLTLGTVRQQNDPRAQAGTVLEASQAAGDQVPPGTPVNLVVANGKVTIEDMTGWTVDSAQKALEKLALTAAPTELGPCSDGQSPNTVISMSAAPGEVDILSTVELRYCTAE